MQYPGAIWKPCSNQSGTMSAHLGLVLHVQEGNNDLTGEFNDPNSQASYTWDCLKDGTLIQFCDANARAWAQIAGNGTYNSVGTQGFTTESLTEAQCQTLAKLYKWGHDTFGWPYQITDVPGTPGFGWHGMGCNYNWGHCTCPGDLRRNQRQYILDIAQGLNPTQPVQPPVQPPVVNTEPTLAIGANGPAVVSLQKKLGIPADGSFGPQTEAAVRAFQQSRGIAVDGVVGPQTWQMLDHQPPIVPPPVAHPVPPVAPTGEPTLAIGATGDAVRMLQTKLGVAVDGDFGPLTQAAVREFQSTHGLTVDGICGPQTWGALNLAHPGAPVLPAAPPAPPAPPVAPPAPVEPPEPAWPGRYLRLVTPWLSGEDVKTVQTQLHISADGVFGPQTESAVVNFQRSHGLSADGVVGPNTWNALWA